jgi:hypothetical protein
VNDSNILRVFQTVLDSCIALHDHQVRGSNRSTSKIFFFRPYSNGQIDLRLVK